MPFTVAKSVDDYPYFDKDADEITYDLWHGYTRMDKHGRVPRYAFGHGLSYASFDYRSLKALVTGDQISVQTTVTNWGDVIADEVIQVYVRVPGIAANRQEKLLKAFQRVTLPAGGSQTVHLAIATESLKWRDPETHSWRLESGEYGIMVGGSSDALIEASVHL